MLLAHVRTVSLIHSFIHSVAIMAQAVCFKNVYARLSTSSSGLPSSVVRAFLVTVCHTGLHAFLILCRDVTRCGRAHGALFLCRWSAPCVTRTWTTLRCSASTRRCLRRSSGRRWASRLGQTGTVAPSGAASLTSACCTFGHEVPCWPKRFPIFT